MKTKQRDRIAVLGEVIARQIGAPRYNLWFERHTRFAHAGEGVTVGVPNRHFQEWLEKTFGKAVEEAAAEVFGRPTPVRFVIDPELFRAARREQAAVEPGPLPEPTPPAGKGPWPDPHPAAAAGRPRRDPAVRSRVQNLPFAEARAEPEAPETPKPDRAETRRGRRWLRLADFVVGPCNRVAYASALSVVETPGDCANPLLLYGPVGTGKTHLLEGIHGGLRRSRPEWRTTYVTAEEFTNRFVQAVRLGKLHAFRKQFRECDVLLVDDLHFLVNKKSTQEEFLHTFDALLADGRQVVLTCDCHPRLADDFPPEMVDRLLGGAVWGLTPPSADTRLAMLRAKARQLDGPPLPDAVLAFLSGQLRGNVRELEGALQGIRHYSRVTGRAADVALVREALADLLRHAVRVVQVADVDQAVTAELRLETGLLRGKGRAWAVSHPRMVAMLLARKHTAASYSEIGAYFGGRNHSTVIAAEKKARAWLESGQELHLGSQRLGVRELVERVERVLFR